MKLPNVGAVEHLLVDLLARPVRCSSVARPGPFPPGLYSTFVDDKRRVRAIAFSDRTFAAMTGAALALIPRGAAEDAIRKGQIPANLLENHAEIVNVATALVNQLNPHADHVRLGAIHDAPAALAPELRSVLTKPSARLDVEADINGYGCGRFSILV